MQLFLPQLFFLALIFLFPMQHAQLHPFSLIQAFLSPELLAKLQLLAHLQFFISLAWQVRLPLGAVARASSIILLTQTSASLEAPS